MHGVALLVIGLMGAGGPTEYTRPLGAKSLDQATLDAEGYGETKALKREDGGLRITLAPGAKETGWKTPQTLHIGGDFTIAANIVIKTLPKPAMEDGVAVGLAIAFQNIDQPDVTLVRVREPKGADVYLSIDRNAANPQMQPGMMMMPFQQPGAKPPKPPRRTFPASGDTVRFELQREGNVIHFQVLDANSTRPRYLGQTTLGNNDVAAVKLFVTNRNGAEPVNVQLRDFTVQADRITGLGTVVRTVFDTVVYGDPTAIEKDVLIVGGPPKAPAQANAGPMTLPDDVFQPRGGPQARTTTPPAAAPAPAPAAAAPVVVAAQPAPAPAQPAAAAAAPAPAPPAAPVMMKAAVRGRVVARAAQPVQAKGTAPPNVQAANPAQPPKPAQPKKIPLDEVDSIRFERQPALSGRFLGQPNVDLTGPGLGAKKNQEKNKDEPAAKKNQAKKPEPADDVLAPPPGTTAAAVLPKVEPRKNGIRDLHLWLSGLRNAAIRQITVNCQTDKGPAAWRLDTSGSEDSPLVVQRAGTEAWADLFLEPPAGDCFQKDFTVAIQYADNQAANVNIKASEHTDPKKALDPKAPTVPQPDAMVYMTGVEKLFGKLERIGEDAVRITTPWNDHLDVPLARVGGIHLGLLERKETPESFARRLKARGSEDLLLAQTKDGEVLALSGIVEGTENDKLRFRYQGRSRTVPLKQVEGLVLAARPDPKEPDELRPVFSLPGGLVVSGRWKDLDTSAWKVETAWGQPMNLPATDIQEVRFGGGKMTYLSDLNPSTVEETPFFGHKLAWRRDVGLLGEPLKINGRTFERGVAVHSRCVLTYDLRGRYEKFEALLGFDDAAKGKGRVDCRVFADGKELYANPDLRADAPPVPLTMAVAGVEQLRLSVDFGRGQDTGDRVIWANARLYRQSPPSTASANRAANRKQ